MNDVLQFDLTPPSEDELRILVADLSEDERQVLLEHGTEAPFCGVFLEEQRGGVYTCRLCGLPLFKASAKFESGTGWPSFTTPFSGNHLQSIRDTSHGMVRTEIVCTRCGAHQGHVFPDGPPPASDTASILSRSNSRRMVTPSRTNSAGVLPRARYGRADGTRDARRVK